MNSFKTLTSVQIRCANVLKSLLTQLFPHKVPGSWPEYFSLYASMLLTFIAISVDYARDKGSVEISCER